MKNKRILLAFFSLVLIFSVHLSSFAHSGRTDWSGGHRDRRNSSGLGYYHYHCGGYPPHLHNRGFCPYTTPASKIIAVNIPESIDCGECTQLEGDVYPDGIMDTIANWESNTPEFVTVTASGKLHAVGVGEATVTAITSLGTKTTFTINVNEVFAQSININLPIEKNRLKKGDIIELKAVISPENTTDKSVTWFVSDTSIAQIDKNGNLTAISPGTVTVTATTSNGIQSKTNIEVYSYKALYYAVGAALVVFAVCYLIRKHNKN